MLYGQQRQIVQIVHFAGNQHVYITSNTHVIIGLPRQVQD
jgi:hypothetical protein